MLQANSLLQNRYRLISQIGKGGMGTVYVAKDENLGVTVAVKQNSFTDDRLIEAFKREARLLASLRHPALPQIKDHFIVDGMGQFLVMEFITGDDLETILEKRRQKIAPEGEVKPFEVEQVMHWAEQLLDALDYLHTLPEPVIHRDIKPQNLKLAERNQIILLDFGLAKGKPVQMTRVTTAGSLHGYTPNYAPIEQIRGIGTDPRSDLYALGATLYHLLSGWLPIDAASRADTFLGGEVDPLRPVNELNPQVPQSIADLLMKSMEQHRNNRPASAAEMLKMLRAARHSTIIGQQTRPQDVTGGRPSEKAESSRPQATQPQREGQRIATYQPAEPARVTTPQQLANSSFNAGLLPVEQPGGARKKWLVIGGLSLLSIALAIIAYVLIARYTGGAKTSGEKLQNSSPFVTDAGVLKTSGKVFKVAMSGDGQAVAAACDEAPIRLWQPNLAKELIGQTGIGRSVAISRDGQTVLAGCQDGTVRLWNLSDAEVISTLSAHSDYVFGVGFSPDGKSFYTTGGDKTVKLWQINETEPLKTINIPESGFEVSAVSADLKLVGFYNQDGRFKLWSITDDSFLRYLEGDEVPRVSCAAFSADGQMLALGSRDGQAQLWRTADGRRITLLGKFEFAVVSLAFSADRQKLAAGLMDGKIEVWRLSDGNVIRRLEGHTGAVNSLSFSADGKTLASGSDDNSVRVWILEP
jgi:eukaryotic-like serine/threonine-protein kinase